MPTDKLTTVSFKPAIKDKLDSLCPKKMNYDDFIETLLDKAKKGVKD